MAYKMGYLSQRKRLKLLYRDHHGANHGRFFFIEQEVREQIRDFRESLKLDIQDGDGSGKIEEEDLILDDSDQKKIEELTFLNYICNGDIGRIDRIKRKIQTMPVSAVHIWALLNITHRTGF